MANHKTTVFLVWNMFQYLHFKPLLQRLPNATLVEVKRSGSDFVLKDYLHEISNPVILVDYLEVHETIQDFARIIIVQTIFEQIYKFTKAKVMMLQYGYAKEKHNYGDWRALANLNLVYGEYTKHKISHLSPTKITGCPRFDRWYNSRFHYESKLKYTRYINKNNPTILYAPSWGDISSFNYYIDELSRLHSEYNILIKIHHNDLLTKDKEAYRQKYPHLFFFFEDTELLSLLSVTDVLLSDYSGAIFEGIYCYKPLLLLGLPESQIKNCGDIIGEKSLELARRDELGYIVNNASDLEDTIQKALAHGVVCSQDLYNLLFFTTHQATDEVILAINEVLKGKWKRSVSHMWYFYKIRRRLRIIANKREKNRNR